MSAIKKKPRKSKLVVRDDLPMEVQVGLTYGLPSHYLVYYFGINVV